MTDFLFRKSEGPDLPAEPALRSASLQVDFKRISEEQSNAPRTKVWVLLRHICRLTSPITVGIDGAVIVSASIISGVVYHRVFLYGSGNLHDLAGIGLFGAGYFILASALRGSYHPLRLIDYRSELREVAKTWLRLTLILLGALFLLKASESFSRGATLGFLFFGFAGLAVSRSVVAHILRSANAIGALRQHKIILIADEDELLASPVLRELREAGYWPEAIFCLLHQSSVEGMSTKTRVPIDEILSIARKEELEEILLLLGWQREQEIAWLINALSIVPLPIRLLPDRHVARFLDQAGKHSFGIWSTVLLRAPLTPGDLAIKRFVDVVVASAALILFAPLLLIIALAVRLESPAPVFFRQTRHGFNGREFRIFKFRTMMVSEDGALVKQAERNDPRVTHLGRWLRRTSLDELPQLLNVLRGEMSLVGPRPHAAAHNNAYEKLISAYAYRHHVKPGITGWAQVNGLRGETPTLDLMERRIQFDLWYIRNWSMWLDLKIICKTILVLGSQRTAY